MNPKLIIWPGVDPILGCRAAQRFMAAKPNAAPGYGGGMGVRYEDGTTLFVYRTKGAIVVRLSSGGSA